MISFVIIFTPVLGKKFDRRLYALVRMSGLFIPSWCKEETLIKWDQKD